MFRNIFFTLLRLTLIPIFVREIIQKKRVTIVYCHAPSPQNFEKQIKILKSKYNIISLCDFITAKQQGNFNKLPQKALIITLDDGHKSNYNLKSVLDKYNIPISIFLCSGIVDTKRHFWFLSDSQKSYDLPGLKKMTDDERLTVLTDYGYKETKCFNERQALSRKEIEEMKHLVDFQSHTVFHPILPKCSDEKSFKEISLSKKDLEIKYNLKIYALSFPNGDYSDREIKFAKQEGYKCALTCDPGFNTEHTDIFRLKRISIAENGNTSEILVRASGLWSYIKKITKRYSHGYVATY